MFSPAPGSAWRSRAATLSLLGVLSACSVHDPSPAGFDASVSLDAPFDSPDTGPLSDAEILGVLHTIHQGDLMVTDFMAANTVRQDVRAFAMDLSAQHSAADASLSAAASAAGVTPADSAIRRRQESLRMQELDALMAESCGTRDERYLGLQALFSNEALGIIDGNLLPAVMNTALRNEIQTTRAVVAAQAQGLPLPDGAAPEASVPNWEAGASSDSGCPSTAFDAYFDVGPDS